jgi:hypothetical protein
MVRKECLICGVAYLVGMFVVESVTGPEPAPVWWHPYGRVCKHSGYLFDRLSPPDEAEWRLSGREAALWEPK